jgi:hypothetical protein
MVLAYLVGGFVAALGVAHLAVIVFVADRGAMSRRMRAAGAMHGAMWFLIGGGLVLGQAASSQTWLVALCLCGALVGALSGVVAGREPWRRLGTPEAWQGRRNRS